MNARLGLIFRPKEYFRVGVAIHTPTFNGLTDTRTTTLKTVLENPPNEFNSGSDVFTGNRPGQGSYFHNTPWKFIVSGSYVFRETENIKQQRGFITADIEYVNHRNTRFFSSSEIPDNTEKAYYNALNKIIKARYRESFNFKIGGEIKYNVFMGRVGFAYYTNPYREIALKANQLLLSGGLGYRDKGFFADLTYQHKFLRYAELPYRLEDRANTFAAIRQQQGTFILTVGIKL